MQQPTDSEINKMVQDWVQESVDWFEECRVGLPPQSPRAVEEVLADLEQAEAWHRAALGRGEYSAVDVHASRLLQERGLVVQRDSYGFRKLSRELMKATIQHIQIEQLRSKGKYDELPAHFVSRSPAQSRQLPEYSLKLSRLFDEYAAEMITGKRWRDKTRREHTAMFRTVLEILGDLHVSELDKARARDYKAALQQYPRNRHKDRRYRNRSLPEIRSMSRVDTLSVVTVNNHLIKMSGMLRWAVNQGYCPFNPFENLTIRTGGGAKDDVLPFTRAELASIFSSDLYQPGARPKPYQFWLPILALYTGARIEELCQLHLEDVREEDGVWVIDFNDRDDRNLKTNACRRLVPIHPELVRIGLHDYIDLLRRMKKGRLFPELNAVGGKYSHYPSIAFGRLKRGLGMPARKKVLHSFRHGFADMLRRVRAHDHEIKMLLGHETGSVTHDRYGGASPVRALFEVVNAIDVGVDLSSVRWKSNL